LAAAHISLPAAPPNRQPRRAGAGGGGTRRSFPTLLRANNSSLSPPPKKSRKNEKNKGMAGGSRGLFTSTNPELRRVVPDGGAAGRVRVKVVYTVLEAQYQSALTAAVKAINASNKTVCFELVGYLLEELRDETNYALFEADLADANIFIGSLIFIEELAEKVCLWLCCLCVVFCVVCVWGGCVAGGTNGVCARAASCLFSFHTHTNN
jgi:hypothetical protein